MLKIGFAKVFYTLWDIKITKQQIGNYIETFTECRYQGRISKYFDRVKEKYPDIEIDLTLKGTSSFEYSQREYIPEDPDKFQFGKYKGEKIKDCIDCNYLEWYYNQGITSFAQELILDVLRENGYYIAKSEYNGNVNCAFFKTEEEYLEWVKAEEQRIRIIELSKQESGTFTQTFEKNLDDVGRYCIGHDDTGKTVYLVFKDFKLMQYNGFYYGLPTIKGIGKKLKNKTFEIQYTRAADDYCIEYEYNGYPHYCDKEANEIYLIVDLFKEVKNEN